eukprot:SAG22_NODE_699_length_7801_cov_6.003116_2_plen_826_part_00
MIRCKKGDAVNWDTATEWLDTAAEPLDAEGGSGSKIFVERSKAVALLLQRDDLDSLVQQLSESTVQENPPTEFSPFCIQPYLVPENESRFVAVYMRNDHGTACEVFPVSYSSRYLDVAADAAPSAPQVMANVADSILLELRHVMLSMVTFMRKAHGLAFDGLVCEFVQSASSKQMLFNAVLGTQQPGKPASWTSSYDAEGQLVRDLVEKLYTKQPAMKVFNRSSVLPGGAGATAGPQPSPGERVAFKQQAEREVEEILSMPAVIASNTAREQAMQQHAAATKASGGEDYGGLPSPRPPTKANSPDASPKRKIKGGKGGGGGTPRKAPQRSGQLASQSVDSSLMMRTTMTLDTLGESVPESAFRGAVPGRTHTLASLRFFQIETLKDALQEQFASATQSELERLQEANRRQQAVRELESAAGAHAELQRYHDAEMEKASGMIKELRHEVDSMRAAKDAMERELTETADERDFLRRELANERQSHDEKTLQHGGRIRVLEEELERMREMAERLQAEARRSHDEDEEKIRIEREEREALNKQLINFAAYIEQLERTRDEQLAMIVRLKDGQAELLRATPAISFVKKAKIKVNLNDLLCQEENPQREAALVQDELYGRRMIVQELYKYYSWTPEGDDASQFAKLTMSGENFVKFCVDAGLLAKGEPPIAASRGTANGAVLNGGGFTKQWAMNVFVASCLQRYRNRRRRGLQNKGSSATVAAPTELLDGDDLAATAGGALQLEDDGLPPGTTGLSGLAKTTPVSGRYLKLSEFNEALVRLGYARYPGLPNLSERLLACMQDFIVPFAKHKGTQVSNWFQSVCEKEALAFA